MPELIGDIIYGSWKNGAAIFRDKKGFYIVDVDKNGEEYKNYCKGLQGWKYNNDDLLYLDKEKKKWITKKTSVTKKSNVTKKTSVTKKNETKKYKDRPSPPYPANDWCGKNKKGNDGNMYTSKPNKNGICRWVKYNTVK